MGTWKLFFYEVALGSPKLKMEVEESEGVFRHAVEPAPDRPFNTVDIYFGGQCQLRLRYETTHRLPTISLSEDRRELTISGLIPLLLIKNRADYHQDLSDSPVSLTLAVRSPLISLLAPPKDRVELSWDVASDVGLINSALANQVVRFGGTESSWVCPASRLFAAHDDHSRFDLVFPAARKFGGPAGSGIALHFGAFVERRDWPDLEIDVPRWRLVLIRQAEFNAGTNTSELRKSAYLLNGAVAASSGSAVAGYADLALEFGQGDVQFSQALPWTTIANEAYSHWVFGLRGASLRGRAASVIGLNSAGVLRCWQRLISDRLLAGLSSVRGAESISFVPELELSRSPEGLIWAVLCPAQVTDNGLVPNGGMRIRAQSEIAEIPVVSAQASLRGLRDHDGQTVALDGALRFPRDHINGEWSSSLFDLRLQSGNAAPTHTPKPVAIGALDLRLKVIGDHLFRLSFDLRSPSTTPRIDSSALFVVGQLSGLDANTPARFPVSAVRPAAMDMIPEEATASATGTARSDALVVANWVEGDFCLDLEEIYRAGRNRSLNIDLLRLDDGGSAGLRTTVIDPAPFLVAAFDSEHLFEVAGDGAAQSRAVAVFDTGPNGLLQWEYRFTDSKTTVTFPPQAIGEAYEYRKNIEDSALVDYRLGIHGMVEQPNDTERRAFALLPSNWRHLYGYAGQPNPGAEVTRAKFELLYGLNVDARGRGLRLVEHGAERGRLAPAWPEEQTNADQDPNGLREAWNKLRDQLRYRLANLELSLAGQSTLPLQPEGESLIQVRADADLARPGESNTATRLKGALWWPIRSANLRRLLDENGGRSSSGRLDHVSLTALGGYGEQLARFAGDRMGIETRTSQGRISYHSVEVIGRVGCFWNRAKYVVIYERTVGRRERYAEGSPEQQHALRGRAVVRKVAEFIEILEPERRYPDLGGTAAEVGPILALQFRATRIPVSDQWSREVGQIGWAVPLWRQPADPSSPTAYERLFPKPQVSVALAGSAGDAFWSDIENPDNLVFFAYTAAGANDRTDSWPAIRGVDRVEGELPPIAQRWTTSTDSDARELDRPSPPPMDVPALIAPCTWRIATAALQTDVLAGRTPEPIGAVIDVITMMRGAARPSTTSAELNRLALPALITDLSRQARDEAERLATSLNPDEVRIKVREFLSSQLTASTGSDATSLLRDWPNVVNAITSQLPCDLVKKWAEDAITARSNAWIDQATAWKNELLVELRRSAEPDLDAARALITEVRAAIAEGNFALERGLAQGRVALDQHVLIPLEQQSDRASQALSSVASDTAQIRAALETELRADRDDVVRRLRNQLALATAAVGAALGRFKALQTKLANANDPDLKALGRALAEQIVALEQDVQTSEQQAESAINRAESASSAVLQAFSDACDQIQDETLVFVALLKGAVNRARSSIAVVVSRIDTNLNELSEAIGEFRTGADALLENLSADLNSNNAVAQVEQGWLQLLELWRTLVLKPVHGLSAEFIDARVCPLLPNAADLAELLEGLRTLLEKVRDNATDLVDTLNRVVAHIDASLDGLRAQADRLIDDIGGALESIGDSALQLLRAVGKPPNLPGLSFNLPRIEFRFDPRLPSVDITPLTSYFAQAGDYLKSLGLRFPTVKLGGPGFEMPDLPSLPFDLNAVIPDFSGIKLDGLFGKLKLPKAARKQIKLKHGIDKRRRIAWAQADVDMPLGGARTLFAVASVEIRLLAPRFIARSRLEIDERGRSRMQSDGRLEGDIQMLVAGTSLVRMVDCQICFDDSGDFDFKFDPKNLEFDGAMLFLTGLMDLIPGSDSAFFPEILERNGRPYGIETKFDLVPPDLQFGTFGISGMQIGVRLRLAIVDGEFTIGAFVGLGSVLKPFTITVFILGGSGWLSLDTNYTPARRQVDSKVVVALGASATLAIRFGPIAGHVQIFFGLRATFYSGRGAGFAIAVLLVLNGGVVIFGFVRVGLHVRLEIEYRSNGALVGRGVVELEVRISRFFKRKVRQRIRHEFKRGRGAAAAKATLAPPTAAGMAHVPAPIVAAQPPADEYAQRIDTYRAHRV